jgi:hypothetical protein
MHHIRLAQVGHFSLWLAVIVALGFAGQSQYSQPSCEGAFRMDEGAGPGRWQDDLYDLLRRHNVTQFAYVSDAGHRILIDRSLADPEVHSVALTSEEEGVAMLAGADLGGARGVLLMQSSGTGNCVNMLSLIKGGRFPFLTLVSMRAISAKAIRGSSRWGRRCSRCSTRWASFACGSSSRRRLCRPSAPP